MLSMLNFVVPVEVSMERILRSQSFSDGRLSGIGDGGRSRLCATLKNRVMSGSAG
jgi:hypothetical protein